MRKIAKGDIVESIILHDGRLGKQKTITADDEIQLAIKIEHQKDIWREEYRRNFERREKIEGRKFAEETTEKDKKIIEKYKSILDEVQTQDYKKYYDSFLEDKKFPSFRTNLEEPVFADIMEEVGVPAESFWERIFKSLTERRLQKEEEATTLYNERTKSYQKELKRHKKKYEEAKAEFVNEQNAHNKAIRERKKKFEENDPYEVETFFGYVLSESKYPDDFKKDFELQYNKENKILIVSYYLPNEEQVPRITQHKFVATRMEIDEIKMKDKPFETFYNDVFFMCCLRTLKEIFSSDELNQIGAIVYNGWVKYIDKSTGQNAESCVITLEVNKEDFNKINLKNVDHKECVKGLKGIFAPSILTLTPVKPILNIDRTDSRFIESKEVANIDSEGYNLATMPWEDFEYFVRELFDKMFNKNGGEVKVTQASHDGGVDAIAFDDDPIRGGKFVIQAKRYNNVVPAAAVRELYGTVINEGAVKGILITTSSYGKDAHKFAKDKPLSLISGQELLGILNQYGYSNLTIKTKRKYNR